MDMTFSTEDLAFRDEVRAFLDICAHACRSACGYSRPIGDVRVSSA